MDWFQNKIIDSVDVELLVCVTQIFDTDPVYQFSGLILFMILMDVLESKSFEYVRVLQKYIITFDIFIFNGENVALATSHLKAVLQVLRQESNQPQALCHLLQGLSQACHEELSKEAKAQLGIMPHPSSSNVKMANLPITKSPRLLALSLTNTSLARQQGSGLEHPVKAVSPVHQ